MNNKWSLNCSEGLNDSALQAVSSQPLLSPELKKYKTYHLTYQKFLKLNSSIFQKQNSLYLRIIEYVLSIKSYK